MNTKHMVRACAAAAWCVLGGVGAAGGQPTKTIVDREPNLWPQEPRREPSVITLQVQGEASTPEQMKGLIEVLRKRLPRAVSELARFEPRDDKLDVYVPSVQPSTAWLTETREKVRRKYAEAGITANEQEDIAWAIRDLSSERIDVHNAAITKLTKLMDDLSTRGDALRHGTILGLSEEHRRGWTDDLAELARGLARPGVLEFRIVSPPDVLPPGYQASADPPAGNVWLPIWHADDWVFAATPEERETKRAALHADPTAYFAKRDQATVVRDGEICLLVRDTPEQTVAHAGEAWSVAWAGVGRDEYGRPALCFRLDDVGAKLLGAMTADNVRKALAVVIDGRIYTAPTLMTAISREGQVTGKFSDVEMWQLERALQYPLPLGVKVVGVKQGEEK